MSSFSWLDYSERDRRAALDVIDKFREHDTRDELGLSSIRDGFAELFFPGTGTVQTRPRYLFFVPWLYQRLEAKKVESAEISRRARRDELALIETLMKNEESDGVIGRQARQKLKRLPSGVYWQGLGALRFRVYQGSQEQYHRSLDRFYREGGLSQRSDDGEILNRARARNWHSALPKAPANFPDVATLNLTTEEAAFLTEQVAIAAPDSLLRHFLDHIEADIDEATYPWDHPALPGLPEKLRDQVEHARNFSEVMHGAALLYNLMLAELCENTEWADSYVEALAEWNGLLQERRSAHVAWSRESFWTLAARYARPSVQTRAFVGRWFQLTLDGSAPPLRGSEAQRTLIRDRERQLKHGQARLGGGRPLEIWNGESGTGRLTYRWAVTWRLLADVQAALAAETADA
jgi:Family of unknown function (DUF6361)